jgi:hypothetical protein
MALRLNPQIKQHIKNALQDAMYAATNRRFDATLKSILVDNTLAGRFVHESFSYKGQYYSFELTVPRFKNQRLLPELHGRMDEYLAEKQKLEYYEQPYVFGFFTKMLNTSNSLLDYYALLPACMHPVLQGMNLHIDSVFPRELSDEQVEEFKLTHADWLMKLKMRMVLDLVII